MMSQAKSSRLRDAEFISARTWAQRWDCSISTVRRAARRFGVRRVFVGYGTNGLVRYRLEDVERIEERCRLGHARKPPMDGASTGELGATHDGSAESQDAEG